MRLSPNRAALLVYGSRPSTPTQYQVDRYPMSARVRVWDPRNAQSALLGAAVGNCTMMALTAAFSAEDAPSTEV